MARLLKIIILIHHKYVHALKFPIACMTSDQSSHKNDNKNSILTFYYRYFCPVQPNCPFRELLLSQLLPCAAKLVHFYRHKHTLSLALILKFVYFVTYHCIQFKIHYNCQNVLVDDGEGVHQKSERG